MTDTQQGTAPCWYPDPAGRHELRWFDGHAWTDQVSDRGLPGRDPLPVGTVADTSDSKGIAAFVLALVWLGGIGSLLGVILGTRAQRAARERGRSDGFAIAGLTLGIVGLVGSALFWLLVVALGVAGSHAKTPAANLSASRNGGVSTFSRNTSHPPPADVKLSGCRFEALGNEATAHLALTNHSTARSTYLVSVTFTDPSNIQIASASTFVANVDPGQSARADAIGFVNGSAPAALRCSVKDVERFAELISHRLCLGMNHPEHGS